MNLEFNQGLHDNVIVNSGNVSASLDPKQIPNDANDGLIKSAAKFAAGKELGLSEEETLSAISRQAKDATSEFSPAFGAENFLKNYIDGLKGKDSADYSVNSLSTPAEVQDPVVMPAGNVDFKVPEVKTRLKRPN